MNEIVRFLDLAGFEDEIKAGRGLKIVVHGPKREYIQVFVVDRRLILEDRDARQAKPVLIAKGPEEQTEEPEVRGGE